MIKNMLRLFLGGSKKILIMLLLLLIPVISSAATTNVPSVGPVRVEFIIFALILLGVALFHKQTFKVAVIGVSVLILFKLLFVSQFNMFEHLFGTNGFSAQLMDKNLRQGEWGIILNLLGLLLGFAILAKIFEESGVPEILPKYLPDNWKGAFILLVFVCVISSFLDNIALLSLEVQLPWWSSKTKSISVI